MAFETRELEFGSKADAVWWMVNNQVARRNLNATQRAVLHADAEALVESIRELAREKIRENGGDRTSETFRNQSAFPKIGKAAPPPPPPSRPTPPPAPIHTSKVLATKASVSHGTMDMVLAVKRHGDAQLLDRMRAI